jgi:cation diffusion facilitator family transporter
VSEVGPTSGTRRGLRLSIIGMFVNIALATVKLIAGLLGHSYALVADAVESMADIFGSVVVWGGLRIGAIPPDENHPYGHGKAEALAALIVAAMLIAAGLGIAVAAVREIITPHHAPAAFTLWVLVGVVVIKETLFRLGRRVHDESGSTAVLADAWHHRSDAITSLAAGIGISVALIGGPAYAPADDVAALFASFIILFNALRLLRGPLHELLDVEQPELIEQARQIAAGISGVHAVEKTFARKSGAHYWVDMHVQVNPQMNVAEAHEIAHRVKDAIRAEMPRVRDVLIHIEPYQLTEGADPAA